MRAALAPDGLRQHRESYVAAMRAYNTGEISGRMRTWTLPFLIRHSGFHTLDHAWEMEDKDLTAEDGTLFAAPPPSLAGLMEVRGLGILALLHCPRAPVLLAAELTPGISPPRLPRPARWRPPEVLALPEESWPPLIRLDPFEAAAQAKIVAAAAAFAHALFRRGTPPL